MAKDEADAQRLVTVPCLVPEHPLRGRQRHGFSRWHRRILRLAAWRTLDEGPEPSAC